MPEEATNDSSSHKQTSRGLTIAVLGVGGALSVPDHRSGSDDQHAAQHLVTGAGNNAKPDLARGRMILWRQPDPCRELASRFELCGIRGLHSQQHRADRPTLGILARR